MNKKGFTLIEIIISIGILTIISITSIVIFNSDNDKKNIEEYKNKTVTSADVFVSTNIEIIKNLEILKYEDSVGYKIIKLSELYDKGLINDETYSTLKDYKDEENNTYDSMAAFLNSDGLIEIKYPYKDDYYLKFDKTITLAQNEPFNCNYIIKHLQKYELNSGLNPENVDDFDDMSLKCYKDVNMSEEIEGYKDLGTNNNDTTIYYSYINKNNVKMLTYVNIEYEAFNNPQVILEDINNPETYKASLLNNQTFVYKKDSTYYTSSNQECSDNENCKNLLKFQNDDTYYLELTNYSNLESEENYIKYELVYNFKQPTKYFDLDNSTDFSYCEKIIDKTYCYGINEKSYTLNVPFEKVFNYYINVNDLDNIETIKQEIEENFIEPHKVSAINSSINYEIKYVNNIEEEVYNKKTLLNPDDLSERFLGFYEDLMLFYTDASFEDPKFYYVNFRTGNSEFFNIEHQPSNFYLKKSLNENMIILYGTDSWRVNDAYFGACCSSSRDDIYIYCGYNYENGNLTKNKCNYHHIHDLTTNTSKCSKYEYEKYYINNILTSNLNFESVNELYYKYNNGITFNETLPQNITDADKAKAVSIINDSSNGLRMKYKKSGSWRYDGEITTNYVKSKFTISGIDYYIFTYKGDYFVLSVSKEDKPNEITLENELDNQKIINIILDNKVTVTNSTDKIIYKTNTITGDTDIINHINELELKL